MGAIRPLSTRSRRAVGTCDSPPDRQRRRRRARGQSQSRLFGAVGPEHQELVGSVTGSRARIARAVGVAPGELLREIQRRLRSKPEVVEVAQAQAPAQQVVLTGDDADLTALPVHLQHGADGAPYISSSTDFVVDPKTGWTNVGIRRLMLRGRKEAGVDLNSPSDLRAIYEASAATGKPVPISFVVGSHPIDHLAAVMRLPVDELVLSLQRCAGAPLPVVESASATTSGCRRMPSGVLEGYLDARGHVEPEGPYGEFLGYYGAVKRNPVFHLTAITRRRDALFQTATIGGKWLSRTDTAQLNAVRTEAMVWRALETAVREPIAVHATASSGGMYTLRVALRQRVAGEARNAIAACFGALTNVKNVFVVDPDIDIFSDEQMVWALATRFQADRDLVVMERDAHPAARSFASAAADRRESRGVRPDLAVRQPPGAHRDCGCQRRRGSRASASPRSRPRSPTARNSSRS